VLGERQFPASPSAPRSAIFVRKTGFSARATQVRVQAASQESARAAARSAVLSLFDPQFTLKLGSDSPPHADGAGIDTEPETRSSLELRNQRYNRLAWYTDSGVGA
jgi:hypothetical protein